MLKIGAAPLGAQVRRVLCLGAHSDDIEIGCGGTVLQPLDARPDLEVDWVGLTAPGERADEASASAERSSPAPVKPGAHRELSAISPSQSSRSGSTL